MKDQDTERISAGTSHDTAVMDFLLAVDLGLRTGLALYGRDGRLIWYRSKHFSSPSQLKKAVYPILKEPPGLSKLIIEGGGSLFEIWKKEASKRAIEIIQISAGTWRRAFLYQRERRNHKEAKENAGILAKKVIEWSGAKRPPTPLKHDAAEAILTGLWGVFHVGWISDLPPEIKKIS